MFIKLNILQWERRCEQICAFGGLKYTCLLLSLRLPFSYLAKKNDSSKKIVAKYDKRRRLDIRYARLGPKNALSAVPTSFPILIREKFLVDEKIFFDKRDGERRLNCK